MRTILLIVLCVGIVFGQAPATQSTFEVASVKPSPLDAPGMFIRPLPGGSLRVSGASLRNLISLAYDVRPFQISSSSQWLDTERYDIDARAAAFDANTPTDPAKPSQDRHKILESLKSLLADRFQLTLHTETREQPVYALLVNKGGPKIQESTDPRGLIRKMGRGTLKGQAVKLEMLALNLSNELGRRVIDKTGLGGKYDFELKWEPRQAAEPDLSADPEGPSIFTALQEQLGLRLEPAKGPVEVLVIDRAQKPSKN